MTTMIGPLDRMDWGLIAYGAGPFLAGYLCCCTFVPREQPAHEKTRP